MADSMYSALTDGGELKAGDQFGVARSGTSYRVTPIGVPVLVYRYTVVGADKASIDTGVDTPDAGSNDWTNGDLLEIFIYARTDESGVGSNLAITLNNDGSSIYDGQELQGVNTTVTTAPQLARAQWLMNVAGATAEANLFSSWQLVVPNYAGTVGYKSLRASGGNPDSTDANSRIDQWAYNYRSTSAITRLKVAVNTGAQKLKVGSQLLIYKRLAS